MNMKKRRIMVEEANFDEIIRASEELKKHDGFLPLLIRAIITKEHVRHLDEIGKYDIVVQEIKTKPQNYEDAINELKKWCMEHKEYRRLLNEQNG